MIKAQLILRMIPFILASLFMQACQTENTFEEKNDPSFEFIELTKEEKIIDGLKIPRGSEIWQGNVGGQTQINYVFPDGIELVEKDEKGIERSFGKVSFVCLCTKRSTGNNHCNILYRPGAGVSCLQGNCNGACLIVRIEGPST